MKYLILNSNSVVVATCKTLFDAEQYVKQHGHIGGLTIQESQD